MDEQPGNEQHPKSEIQIQIDNPNPETKAERKADTKAEAPLLGRGGPEPAPTTCILLCDESRSMGSMTSPFIVAINSFLDEQRKSSLSEYDLCEVISFTGDDSCADNGRFVKFIYSMNLLSAVKQITREQYNPGKSVGGTPLQSVICDTIERYKTLERVVLVVFTDGENSTRTQHCTKHSVEATQTSVQQALARGWDIVMVGPY